MLVISNSVRVWIMRFTGGLCLTSFALTPLQASNYMFDSQCDLTNWVHDQAERARFESDVSEMVNLIVTMRNSFGSEGCEIPNITAFLGDCRGALSNQGFLIEDAIFEALEREIKALEEGYRIDQTSHHKKKKKQKKEPKENSKPAVGFLKFVAGSLLCL